MDFEYIMEEIDNGLILRHVCNKENDFDLCWQTDDNKELSENNIRNICIKLGEVLYKDFQKVNEEGQIVTVDIRMIIE